MGQKMIRKWIQKWVQKRLREATLCKSTGNMQKKWVRKRIGGCRTHFGAKFLHPDFGPGTHVRTLFPTPETNFWSRLANAKPILFAFFDAEYYFRSS